MMNAEALPRNPPPSLKVGGPGWEMFAVYVHVPFCRRRCTYCDFATAPVGRLSQEEFRYRAGDVVAGILAEADFWRRYQEALVRPRTLFIGGGTPTLLPLKELENLLVGLRERLGLQGPKGSDLVEFTVEANPTDLDEELLRLLGACGVTRLSIGVQSLNDALLQRLGRDHDANEAREAFLRARRAGFGNINVDLIFAFPGQTMVDWMETLAGIVRMRPEHVSCYALDLARHTPLGREVALGKACLPPEELQAEMYEYADAFLTAEGYEHYEISNFALPGYASYHNVNYWQNGYYLGLGPAAHGHLPGCRYANISGWRAFVSGLAAGVGDATPRKAGEEHEIRDWVLVALEKPGVDKEAVERISARREMEDTMITGLRLATGVSSNTFAARFGVTLEEAFGDEIAALEGLGVLERTPERVRLTRRGWLTSNVVLSHFLR